MQTIRTLIDLNISVKMFKKKKLKKYHEFKYVWFHKKRPVCSILYYIIINIGKWTNRDENYNAIIATRNFYGNLTKSLK